MALTREQSLRLYGTEAYTAWGEAEAAADSAAHPEKMGSIAGSGSGFQTPEQYANALLEAQKKQRDEEIGFLEKYTKDNPFIFDEELARKSATAEYEPYYTELLKDYLSGVELKRANIQDEKKLLTTLNTLDTGQRTRNYTEAVERANEGFVGSGLFYSGIKDRKLGRMEVDYQAGTEGAAARYGNAASGLERSGQALTLEQQQKERDVGREQQTAVEGGILQRQKETQNQYYTPLVQSYFRRFPSGSQGSLSGYTLPSYVSY